MRTVIYLIFVLLFVLLYFPLFFVAWLMSVTIDKKGVVIQYISSWFSRGLLITNPWWRVKINGLENLDRKKTYLVVINHRSLYDIPLVNLMNINTKWVAKHELLKTPILGQLLFFRNDIMVKRGDPESTKAMMLRCFGYLKNGISIAIFPEGTRSKTGGVDEFKEGAFLIAKKARVPILPIVVEGTWEAEKKGEWGLLNPNTFVMNILPEIPVEKIKEKGIKELSDYTHDIIYNKHKELAPQLYENK